MEGALEKAQAAAAIARMLNPAEMIARLSRVDSVSECAEISRQASGAAINALLTKCIAAGRAQEIAGIGDEKTTAELADEFGLSKRTIERFGRIYREIIKPRCERDGKQAQFLLEEQAFYLVATEAAPVVERPAFELIEEAEEKKAADAKFSAAKWKRELGLTADEDEGSTRSDAKSFWRAIKRFAKKFEGLDVKEAAEAVDPLEVLDDTRDALVQIREALNALEERMQGRVDV